MSLMNTFYTFPLAPFTIQDRVAALVAAGVDAVILDSSQVRANGNGKKYRHWLREPVLSRAANPWTTTIDCSVRPHDDAG